MLFVKIWKHLGALVVLFFDEAEGISGGPDVLFFDKTERISGAPNALFCD
mgnify:CR=1 FL=1